jgi:hypothetical protein
MARDKATLTLDRDKVRAAMALTGQHTMSDVVDLALDRLLHAERLRGDVAAYTRQPLTDEDIAILDLPVRLDLGDDDADYEALYGGAP